METLEETLEDKKIWRQIKIEKNILNYFKTKGGKKIKHDTKITTQYFFYTNQRTCYVNRPINERWNKPIFFSLDKNEKEINTTLQPN